jgi:protein-S-isoprenylcysteine O-methyltransferase Ste14
MKGSFIERGGIWVVAQGAIMTAVLGLSLVFHGSRFTLFDIATGLLFMAVGAGVGLAGARSLGANLTPFPKPIPEARLVRSGIYARIRHPLYTSVTLLSAGWALMWQSGPAIGAAVVLALFFDIKARSEERWLRLKFAEYEDYTNRTRKFIPWVY